MLLDVPPLVEHVGRQHERVAVAGTANLARYGQEFDTELEPLLSALEEQVVLLKLLGQATSSAPVTVRIGHENAPSGLSSTSIVTTGYGPGEQALGSMAVVGPTRMDYLSAMASVRAVAKRLSEIATEHE